MRAIVRREANPRMSILGPAGHWWGVWLTPFQQVASFENRIDALNWAARSRRKRATNRENGSER